MKKTIFLAASLLWLHAFSQNATLRVQFDKQDIKRKLSLSRPILMTQFPVAEEVEDIIINNGIFSISLKIDQPEIMYLKSTINDVVEFNQPVFLKAGYAIEINCIAKNGKPFLTITGKGAADNQQWEFSNTISFNDYPKDTLPERILADLQKEAHKNENVFNQYIALNHPSVDFINSWAMEMQYTPIRIYYVYAKQRKSSIGKAYTRNKKTWDDAFDQMLTKAPLMNEAALNNWAYRVFLKMFLIFNKPHVLDDAATRELYVKNWYADSRDTGVRSYYVDDNNIPNQKTIEKYFSGKVKEYLYAHLFKMALETGKLINLDAIYSDFLKQFPGSSYKKIYGQQIAAGIESLKRSINDKMIFESANIQTWEEVLTLFKGKTVLLDMWGTWCGPCRNELEKNSPTIKKYFKNKGLDFLYIANNDQKNIKEWKSLITYFNMEGHHILASENLTNDIEKNIELRGYPTYVILHKNGTYEVTKAGMSSPEEMKILITQIESALYEK